MPVRVTSYGKEDPDDLHEVMVVQQLYRLGTETQLSNAQVTNAVSYTHLTLPTKA